MCCYPLRGDVNKYRLSFFAENLQVSDNGQFVFAAVARPLYVLKSMERVFDICSQLQKDETDPFLLPWRSECDASTSLPTVSDFLQMATVCMQGLLCPSFNDEVVSVLPDGYYSLYGFDVSICQPGYFCRSGARSPCPVGYQCPRSGMTAPELCDVSNGVCCTSA